MIIVTRYDNRSNRKEKGTQAPLKHFLPADLSSPERLFAPGLGDVKAGMLEEDAVASPSGYQTSAHRFPHLALGAGLRVSDPAA